VALGFLLGFLGLLVHAVGSNTFIIVRIMEPFCLYAALVVRGPWLLQADQSVEQEAGAQPALAGSIATGRSAVDRPGLAGLGKP
jgi:hypothetical protein